MPEIRRYLQPEDADGESDADDDAGGDDDEGVLGAERAPPGEAPLDRGLQTHSF